MELHPDYIKENLDQIGKKEGLVLLREWIDSSSDQMLRQIALTNYGLIEEGKSFKFFEHLFLSDEDVKIRLIAGKILKERYMHNKKLIPLLSFTLTKLDNIEQQIFAIDTLNLIESVKARKLLVEYLQDLIKEENTVTGKEFREEILKYSYSEVIPTLLLDVCINIILNRFYTHKCRYHVTLRNGKIISLNCESSNLSKVSDIKLLDRLKKLEHLHLQRNNIEKIQGFHILQELRSLDVSYNKLEKIENLGELKKLEDLNLSNNKIRKIEGVESLKNLKKLSLNNNYIEKIENLDILTNLEVLDLSHNHISKIQNLENLIQLNRLNLSFNIIESITALQNLINLIELYLNNNKLSQIRGLLPLENLKVLYLSNNSIEKIESLENLVNLKKLELSNNKIGKLEGLENLVELQELYLDNNRILMFENLNSLHSLIMLHLGKNNISEFRREKIEDLKNLNFIFLNENPLDQKSIDEYHKRLKFP